MQQDKEVITHFKQELYSGPIPHPDILLKFKEIDDSFPNRIMRMTESLIEEDLKKSEREHQEDLLRLKYTLIGQILTFIISIAGLVCAVILGLKGNNAGVIASVVAGLSPSLIAFFKTIKKK